MGANVFRHFIQIESLIVSQLPPPLEFSITPIKTKKEYIVGVPISISKLSSEETFVYIFVTFMYEASEPIGSQ